MMLESEELPAMIHLLIGPMKDRYAGRLMPCRRPAS